MKRETIEIGNRYVAVKNASNEFTEYIIANHLKIIKLFDMLVIEYHENSMFTSQEIREICIKWFVTPE